MNLRSRRYDTRAPWALALTLAFGVGVFSSEAEASETKLIGKWKIDRMVKGDKQRRPPPGFTITMEFKKDHTLIGEMRGPKSRRTTGTWKLDGSRLITTMKGKGPETLIVKFVGSHLELSKDGKPVKMVLVRVL